jgi:integrase
MHAAIGDELVPLSPPAAAAFKELRALAQDSEWVVASPHRKASSRGHMRETALNKIVYWLLKNRRLEMPRWTPHDLRRTARSYWSEKLSIPWDLCERLLGHALPTVARTYDTGSYLEQRREALEKWAAYLERIALRNRVMREAGGSLCSTRGAHHSGPMAASSYRTAQVQMTEYPISDPDLQVELPMLP